MNASVAIQVLPNVQDEEEVIRIVDEVIAYIRSTGLNYYVGPFETTIEGDYDQLMDIVKECQHVAERAGCKDAYHFPARSGKHFGNCSILHASISGSSADSPVWRSANHTFPCEIHFAGILLRTSHWNRAGICVCNYDGSVPCNGSGILSDHDHYADHTDHCHCANSGALDGIWNGT